MYIQVYISYFFVRVSVLLFVLRLLPSYKKWQQRVVHVVFLLSFLVTLYTCIAFGVSCIPFKANWETVPNSKCFSKDVLVITNQINACKTQLIAFRFGLPVLVLTLPSSCMRVRHRHCLDTDVPIGKFKDEG